MAPGMIKVIDECVDGHRCENGSMCVENPYDEGNYRCDCDTVDSNSIYVGLYCEHEATVFCTFDGSSSSRSFCTNRGKCKGTVAIGEAHKGCNCPKGYTGDYCQFVGGVQAPYSGPTTTSEIGDGNPNTPSMALGSSDLEEGFDYGAIFLFSAIGISAITFLIAFFANRHLAKLSASEKPIESAEKEGSATKNAPVHDELTIDMDGSTLTDLASGSSLPSPEEIKSNRNTVEINFDNDIELT
mmetsp:Transcript_11757/g.14623  ORF Transcript_11757/g.14623 Transcript_11757/m.14623 type:complete len:242 (-) Transcript_11757:128-853(-)